MQYYRFHCVLWRPGEAKSRDFLRFFVGQSVTAPNRACSESKLLFGIFLGSKYDNGGVAFHHGYTH